ncbi:MAG: 6-phospho-beta-glucosidase [Deltaproteobacteria bacterium]|nr:6-phospho-beta-glucosidase [Deltaproteobacteria bacterium]MCB9786264.1 6-phospho-beta-glucosidase [Deltaproteobacteria bacterium]
MKLAIIGGGSTYSPEILGGLTAPDSALGLTELVLQDPRPERLGPVAGFCRRLASKAGASFAVRDTASLDAALDGADFVVVQIRVGGQEGRHADIRTGLDFGLIGQETTGVGGFAKALRSIPEVLEIARRMEQRCPDAWMLNFTNPSGMVTEALLRHGRERVIGLCNVPIEMHMEVAKLLGRPREDVQLDWVGLNHLGWLRKVIVDGDDLLPGLIEKIEQMNASGQALSGPANIPELQYPPGFLRALGMIPSSYVRYFYATDEMLESIQAAPRSRAQEVMEIESELLALYADERQDTLPSQLSKRGGAWYSRLAVDLLGALQSDTPTVHIVNTQSRGTVEGMPDDAVVEVPCRISRAGVEPTVQDPPQESIIGLMRHVKAYERLAVEAAVDRSRDKAYMALVANPLVPGASKARSVLDRLIERGLI